MRFSAMLLTSSFLIRAALLSTLPSLMSLPSAFAAGGAGGGGVTGGLDSATDTGGPGELPAGNAPGGGGGGAGDTGGAGGGPGGTGGAGGAAPGAAGLGGLAGGGGGGGAHGLVGLFLPGVAVTGGAGGAGGTGGLGGDQAGGGGAGGWGAVIFGDGAPGTLGTAITGGAGGAGGANLGDANGGGGGTGGQGLVFTNPDVTVTIQANVTGGQGGLGGMAFGAGIDGLAGAGGVGISGANLALTIGAAVTGGLSGDLATRAAALNFTGGTNRLTMTAGGSLTGGISLNSASLEFAQPTDVTLGNIISGFGLVSKTGAGTLTLTGASTYFFGTIISGGTLAITDMAALASGNVIIGGATLRSNVTGTLGNDLVTEFGATATVAAATGQVLTLTGVATLRAFSVLSFGSTDAAGTIVANLALGTSLLDPDSTAIVVAGGTLRAGNAILGSMTGSAFSTTINAGATLDFDGQSGFDARIANLQGAGTLTNTGLTHILSGNFSGVIAGSGNLEKLGSGTLILTGANTYTGTTEISAGTLQIGDGGVSGRLGSGAIVNDGALIFNRADALAVSNVISGGGTLTQTGGGVLTLSSANTYSGGTTIAAGTLALGDIGAIGSGAVRLGDGMLRADITGSLSNAIEVTAAATGSISAVTGETLTLAGALGLRPGATLAVGTANEAGTVQLNPSTVDLFTPSSLALTVAGGTLIVGNPLVSQLTQQVGSVTVDAGATLNFNGIIGTVGNLRGAGIVANSTSTQISSGGFSGEIAGTGSVDKVGSGTLILTGASTYTGGTTISAGTLRIGAGGATGSVIGNITNNAVLIFDRSNDLSFSGAISGTGALTLAGPGRLTLTGANTYAGGTTISAGTLQLGVGGSSGAITGNVVNNGALVVNRGDAITIAGAISGAGSLRQSGVGALILTGENSYSGGTTIEAATSLQAGAGGTTGRIGQGAVTNEGALIFNRSDSVTFAGGISGTGSLTQAGVGLLVLTGSAMHTGGTVINAGGTLQIGAGGGTGSLAGDVANSGALVFNRSGALSYAGSISATGALTQAGSGTLTLTGANTHTGGTTISAGTLQIGDGGTTGSITGDVVNNAALVFNRSDDLTFSGVVSGTGTLTQAGGGTLTLTAANTHTGGTTISAGTLSVSGAGTLSTGSTVTVAEGGTLTYETGTNAGNNSHIVQGASRTSVAGAVLQFLGTASAGSGTYTNTASTAFISAETNVIRFQGNSTAGTATIINAGGVFGFSATPLLVFQNNSSMGAATIISQGGAGFRAEGGRVRLRDSATAGTANITLGGASGEGVGGASLILSGTSTAASANIVVNGGASFANPGTSGSGAYLIFEDDSTAGSAMTTANGGTGGASGGLIWFRGTNSAPLASIRLNGNSSLDISSFSGSAFEVALLSGEGSIALGGNELRLGNTNADMTISGIIRDLGFGGGSGGSLTKLGTGTLTLSGENSYTGGTLINGGTLQVGEGGGTGSLGTGRVVNNAALIFNRNGSLPMPQAISGTGSVSLTGPGMVILSGTNTYTGGTVISAGTLLIGGGGTTGSITGDVTNNGRLAFNRSDSVAFPGTVSGTGTLVQAGTGTVILTGANTHTGGTMISAGTLQIGGGGTTGSITGDVVANGRLAFNRSDAVTFTGAISGAGSLAHVSVGTLTLTGANTYTGGTTVSAGTLQISGGGSIGSGDVVNNGTLIFQRGDAMTLPGAISGAGGLVQSGAGTVILTGNNTYSGTTVIDALRTLQVGDGGTTGSLGSGNVVNNGTLVVDRSGSVTVPGAISGSGGLTQNGAGNLILTGVNTYTGPTMVNFGTLSVNGSLAPASVVTLAPGATLGGTGTLGSLTVGSGGTFAPGNSVGTINLAGNLTLTAGSTTVIEVQGGTIDRANVTGTAAVAGALRLVPLGGPYNFNTPYVIIQAGSVAGNFSTVSTTGSFGAGVTPQVSSTATQVQLTLTPAILLPQPVVAAPTPAIPGFLTHNLRATAAALDAANRAGGNLTPFFNVYNQPASAIGLAVNQLSGEIATASTSMGLVTGETFLATMLDPSGYGRESLLGGRLRAGNGDGPSGAKRYAFWGAAMGSVNNTQGNSTDGTAMRRSNSAGFALGFDHLLGAQSLIGGAIAVGESNATVSSGLGRSRGDFGQFGLHGSTRVGSLTLAAAGSVTYMGVNTKRTLFFLGREQIGADASAIIWSGRIEARQDGVTFGGVRFQPVLALQAQSVNGQPYTESGRVTGQTYGLRVSGSSNAGMRTELGGQVQGVATIGGIPVSGFARAAWAYNLVREQTMGVGFASLPDAGFTVRGARPDANSALVSAGLELPVAPGFSFGARVDAELSGNVTQVSGTARVRYRF